MWYLNVSYWDLKVIDAVAFQILYPLICYIFVHYCNALAAVFMVAHIEGFEESDYIPHFLI